MTQGGRRVLVVDDNADSANMLAMLLRLAGHDAQAAYDGTSALARAASFVPEVAFLDIHLPDMTGYDLARQLRQQPQFAGLLLVAMTGFDDDEDRRQAREAGFDHHLAKPADPDAVERIVRGS